MLILANAHTDAQPLDEFAREVTDYSAGIPRHVVDLLDRLEQEQLLVRESDGRWKVLDGAATAGLRRKAALTVLRSRFEILSPFARRVAAQVAGSPVDATEHNLHKAFDCPIEGVRFAIAELVEQRILVSGPAGFALHDESLRTIARGYPGAAPRRRPATIALGAAISLLVTAGLLYSVLSAGPTPAHGGGVLYIQGADEFVALSAGTGSDGSWSEVPLEAPALTGSLSGPFLRADGSRLWFRNQPIPGSLRPDIKLLERNSEVPVVHSPGDDGLLTVSPDGSHIIYFSENLATPAYDHDLYVARLEGGEPHRLHAGAGFINLADWSPDGSKILFRIAAPVDTLAVIDPGGTRIASFAFDYLRDADWCGQHRIAATVDRDARLYLAIIDLETGDVTTQEVEGLYHPIACSPTGSAVADAALRNGAALLLVRDIFSERETQLPLSIDRSPQRLTWHPDAPRTVPTALALPRDTVRIAWGESVPLQADLVYSDGSSNSTGIQWSSSDQGIATSSPAGIIHGNRPGIAIIRATRDGWLSDSTIVLVSGSGRATPLFYDAFSAFGTHRWLPVDSPVPYADSVNGESVLVLPGDGIWADGIYSREAFQLRRGATLEIEFRLRLSRRDRQRIELCLARVGRIPDKTPARDAEYRVTDKACFLYPADELAKFRADRAHFYTSRASTGVAVDSTAIATESWTHLALQLRADGQVSVYVDHRLAARLPFAVNLDSGEPWRIGIFGSAVDTRLLVRYVALWDGPRYVDGLPTPAPR